MPDQPARDQSVQAIATYLHVHPMTVYRWLWDGLVPATWDGQRWWLSIPDAEAVYIARMVRPMPGAAVVGGTR